MAPPMGPISPVRVHLGRPVTRKGGKIKCFHTGYSSAASHPDKGFPHLHPKLLRGGWGE